MKGSSWVVAGLLLGFSYLFIAPFVSHFYPGLRPFLPRDATSAIAAALGAAAAVYGAFNATQVRERRKIRQLDNALQARMQEFRSIGDRIAAMRIHWKAKLLDDVDFLRNTSHMEVEAKRLQNYLADLTPIFIDCGPGSILAKQVIDESLSKYVEVLRSFKEDFDVVADRFTADQLAYGLGLEEEDRMLFNRLYAYFDALSTFQAHITDGYRPLMQD